MPQAWRSGSDPCSKTNDDIRHAWRVFIKTRRTADAGQLGLYSDALHAECARRMDEPPLSC